MVNFPAHVLMLFELLLFFTILYALQIGFFAWGAHRARYPSNPTYRPSVSVIVAARNEEAHLRYCLDSLSRLTYPKEKLEVLVVNDHSTDATGSIIEDFARRFPFIKSLDATHDVNGTLRGKANAIAQGVEQTTGEIILFTDADCVVQKGWVEETVKYYDAPSVGLVAGFTSLRSRTPFEAIQALDWFVLFSVAAGTTRLRFPVTAVGNNLSVRREAYNSVGGYRSIPFSVTEDYALFHAITRTARYVARFPIDPATLVFSLPCESWKELYHQKKRWFIGGAAMDWKSLSLFAVGYGFKALLVVTLVAGNTAAAFSAFALKTLLDVVLVWPALAAFRAKRLLWYVMPFEIYYTLYVLLFPLIVAVSRNVSWKERKFPHAQK
jgi:cellulose synthase/poly-beta-1,6-N-acetylglucosamine synthase-like glycosyltransferase